jgi:hypothetical protein
MRYMKKQLLILSVLLLLLPLGLTAQTVTMAGTVTDEQSGQPVEFASILMKENGFWAITDAKGAFSIKNVPVLYHETGKPETGRGDGDSQA